MKLKIIDSIEKRIVFYIAVSAVITISADAFFYGLIYYISSKLHFMGYRSEIMGPDGLDPEFRNGLLIFLGILIFLLSFFALIWDYIKYVKLILRGMQNISEGDFDTKIPVKTADELGQIAQALNQMQENIKEIMERERMTENAKNDLVSCVAHDLRTPLTSIIGYIGLIRSHPELDQETKSKYLDIAYRKAENLERLTNELFGFVKLEHQEMSLQMGILNLRQLLEQLMDEMYLSFEKNQLETEFICWERDVCIEGDGNLIARLFENLLNNAVKYGKDGKIIRIELEKKEESAVARIVNYGHVIPEDEIDKLFHKFYRVEKSRSLNTGGSGLGLAIVEQIVQLHNGSISVKSDLEGTVFQVVLPCSQKERGNK